MKRTFVIQLLALILPLSGKNRKNLILKFKIYPTSSIFHKIVVLTSLLFMTIVSSQKTRNKSEPKAKLYVTTPDKKNLLSEQVITSMENMETLDTTIVIDPSTTYQEIDGFGYTLTGGSAYHIHHMTDDPKKELLQELFGTGENAIGVSYLRVSIGGSDLDEKPWSYNDLQKGEIDMDLDQFSLGYDTLYLIPVLKEILKIAPEIKIMGSPWSPPHWMKDNNDTRGGSLKEDCYDAYANYFVKYIKAMEDHGITVDAITIQNEPLHPGNNPSLLMLAKQQAEFVKNHLGPNFTKHAINSKIIVYDHNADRPDYPITILNDAEAAKYIDGSAFHLYGGKIEALSKVHEAHPNKNLYFTEQWIGSPANMGNELSWHMKNVIIGATRNWSKTALEWNLAADENQDPHTDRGGCDRCLGALTISGDTVIREPAYYIIAHASKFVRPGSIRIASNIPDSINNVAFKTPEGRIAIILHNENENDKNIQIKLKDRSIYITLKASAVATLTL